MVFAANKPRKLSGRLIVTIKITYRVAHGANRSGTWFLSANGVAFRHHLAIPIWTETSCLMEIGKSHDHESEEEQHYKRKQDADDVGARRVALRPSHLSIHQRSHQGLLRLAMLKRSIYAFD